MKVMPRSALNLTANPVRIARKRLGKTVKQIAKEADVHFQAWYLTECGCYNRVPPVILKYLFGKNILISNDEYQKFRQDSQALFGARHFNGCGLPAFSNTLPPIEAFRLHCGIESRAAFAKGLCVQVALLYKLEHGEVRHLPAQVFQALITAGLPVEEVEELDERTVEFYESH